MPIWSRSLLLSRIVAKKIAGDEVVQAMSQCEYCYFIFQAQKTYAIREYEKVAYKVYDYGCHQCFLHG